GDLGRNRVLAARWDREGSIRERRHRDLFVRWLRRELEAHLRAIHHVVPLRRVVHLEREDRARANLERGALCEFHHVRAGRGAADQGAELPRRCVKRVLARWLGLLPIRGIAQEQRLRTRRTGWRGRRRGLLL